MHQTLNEGEGYFVHTPEDRLYLTGFTGSDGWVVVADTTFLLVDSRYYIQAENQSFPSVEVIRVQTRFIEVLRGLLARQRIKCVYFDPALLTVAEHDSFLKNISVPFIAKPGFIHQKRLYKTSAEIDKLRQAQKITDAAFVYALQNIKIGDSEKEIAWKLERFIREQGGKAAWDPFIVAVGANSASPHHNPTDTKVIKESLIQLDFGAAVDGYKSDMSRVLFMDNPSKKWAERYERLRVAQEAGIQRVKSGLSFAAIDQKVRTLLGGEKERGLYRHGLGHGVGLEVHERPHISMKSQDKAQVGMVFTVEPGLYYEGEGGMRLEDELWLSSDGVVNLTASPKLLADVTMKR